MISRYFIVHVTRTDILNVHVYDVIVLHVSKMAEEEYSEDQESGDELPINKKNNTLPLWGNKETMNINSLILKNIKSSPYFKQDLYRLKTYHEVVDEIFYKVGHLEPWEKNSRKLASQIGHAGEVSGCYGNSPLQPFVALS